MDFRGGSCVCQCTDAQPLSPVLVRALFGSGRGQVVQLAVLFGQLSEQFLKLYEDEGESEG